MSKRMIAFIFVIMAATALQAAPHNDYLTKAVFVPDRAALDRLVELRADITTRHGDTAYVYGNPAEFRRLAGLGVALIEIPQEPMTGFEETPSLEVMWVYHNYASMVTFLTNLRTTYPTLVRLDTVGTTVQGRKMLAIKITDNPDADEDEPEVRIAANIHGDETVGRENCLRMAEYLCVNYGSIPAVTNLVNSTEIWIIPSLNPDGYELVQRYNYNGVDLNRNYPVPDGAAGDDGTTSQQVETSSTIAWSSAHHFILSCNYHGGALVANYPWDYDVARVPDDTLCKEICLGYSIRNAPMYASASFTHGITNGYDWYEVNGSLQDWSYQVTNCLDITIELGDTKNPSASTLDTYWNDNRAAMLWYMARPCSTGVRGIITDSITGVPLAASITVTGNAKVMYSDSIVGNYHRMLVQGTYSITYAKTGYRSKTLSGISVTWGAAVRRDVQLVPISSLTQLEPFHDDFETDLGWTGYSTTGGEWQRGNTGGLGDNTSGYFADPTHDTSAVGTYWIGTDLTGCGSSLGNYEYSLAQTYWLTSPTFDCSAVSACSLSFWKMLNMSGNTYAHGYVQVSKDGTSWTTLFTNGTTSTKDTTWKLVKYDISAVADGQPAVRIRFGIGTTDATSGIRHGGWNIDEVKVTGWGVPSTPPNLVATPPAGWTHPVVPRGTGDASMGAATPGTLLPAPPTTHYLNYAGQNTGTGPSIGSFVNRVTLDGTLWMERTYTSSVAPGASFGETNLTPYTGIGGRHTVLLTLDATGQITESSEADNTWSGQYVWFPRTLPTGVSLNWATVAPRGSGATPNRDGFIARKTTPGQAYGVVAMTATGQNYGFGRFSDYAGPETGFTTPAATTTLSSNWDCFIANSTSADSLMVALEQSSPASSGAVRLAQSTALPTIMNPGVYGWYTLGGADSLFNLHQLQLAPGNTWYVYIEPITGSTADIGAALFPDGTGVLKRGEWVPGGWSNNAGALVKESFTFTPDSPGLDHRYPLLLTKTSNADLGNRSVYYIVLGTAPLARFSVTVSGIRAGYTAQLNYTSPSGAANANISPGDTWSGWGVVGSTLSLSTEVAGATGERWVLNAPTTSTIAAGGNTWNAVYHHEYEVTVTTPYGTANPGGWQDSASTLTLGLSPTTTTAVAGARQRFDRWTGTGTGSYSGTNANGGVTVSAPITETAVWVTQYELTLIAAPGTASGASWYDQSALATFAIDARTVSTGSGQRSRFANWSAPAPGYTGPDSVHAITMTAAVAETAHWVAQVLLTLNSPHSSTVGAGWYNVGATATFNVSDTLETGTAGTRYLFDSWNGTCYNGPNRSHSYAITVPDTETAAWRTEHQLTVVADHGTPFGGGWYPANGEASFGLLEDSVQVNDSIRAMFSAWQGTSDGEAYSGPNRSAMVTMFAPTTEVALYRHSYRVIVSKSPAQTLGWMVVGRDSLVGVWADTVWADSFGYLCSTVSPLDWSASDVYIFSEWADGFPSLAHCYLVESPVRLTALYTHQDPALDIVVDRALISPSIGQRGGDWLGDTTPVIVTNEGNIPLTLGLQGLAGHRYTLSDTVGYDLAVLYAKFTGIAPVSLNEFVADHLVTATLRMADGTRFGPGGTDLTPNFPDWGYAHPCDTLWLRVTGPDYYSLSADTLRLRVTAAPRVP